MHMGWLRLVGSLKLQVTFAKEPHKREHILQKRRIILRSLLIVATPYTYIQRGIHIYNCVCVSLSLSLCIYAYDTHRFKYYIHIQILNVCREFIKIFKMLNGLFLSACMHIIRIDSNITSILQYQMMQGVHQDLQNAEWSFSLHIYECMHIYSNIIYIVKCYVYVGCSSDLHDAAMCSFSSPLYPVVSPPKHP